jgi:hypothetical protein
MSLTETNFLWFLVGDVVLLYVLAYGLEWIVDKVWWWYVDKVLEGFEPDGTADNRPKKPHVGRLGTAKAEASASEVSVAARELV